MTLSLEDSESIASWCGNQQMYAGKIMSPEEKIAKIEKVKIADIKKAANEIFQISKMSVATIGSKKIEQGSLMKK